LNQRKVDEILTMLRKGLEEAEVENDEETDELLAEINGLDKKEKNRIEGVSSEKNVSEEKTIEKQEDISQEGK